MKKDPECEKGRNNTISSLRHDEGSARWLDEILNENPMLFVQWLAVFMIITTILLVPKRSVQVIDISDPAAVWKTDNVPVGLAGIASLTTSVGYKMTSLYDSLMARPDSVTYSKTGMLFGSQIVAETSDFTTQNPELAQMLVEDINYTMVTDLQISERSKATVTTDNIAALKQGTSGVKVQTSTEQGNRAKYQTRVVSNANKVNLKFEEAKPVLEAQLAKSIAGIM